MRNEDHRLSIPQVIDPVIESVAIVVTRIFNGSRFVTSPRCRSLCIRGYNRYVNWVMGSVSWL